MKISRHLIKTMLFWLFISSISHATEPLQVEYFTTPTGIPVMFYHTMDVPILDINLAFHAGSALDEQRFGLSTLTTRLLNQGSNGQDANIIADQFANVGAQFGAENNRDMVLITLRTLTKPDALEPAVQTLASIVQHPDFPEDAFFREKNQQLISIQQMQESPDEVADQTFFQALYQAHPYAHPINGNKTTLEAITKEDVRHFYQKYFTQKNAHIVIVGAIDKTKALALAKTLTQNLPVGQKVPETIKAHHLPTEMDVEVPFNTSQTVLRIGQIGINHQSKDYFPLLVGNYILGGGTLVSELAHELREKRGLTYGVYSQFTPMPGLGPFIIGFSTQNKQAKTAETLTRETLGAFIQHGPSEQELLDAKAYLTGSFPLSLASNQSLAAILTKITFYNLPNDYLSHYIEHINAVTAIDIKNAFQAQINPSKLLQVSVGPHE